MTYTDVFGSATLPPSEYGYASFTLTANATFVWPYNTDGSSYPVAKVMDIACDAGNEVTLPDCTEVSTGEDFLIRNVGANALIVKDAAGVQVASVAVGAASYFYLTDNTSAAGVFGVIGFGVGASTADASSLVGYGIKAVGASLNQAHPVQPTNTGITLSTDHRAKLIVFTGGVATFTLDTAATLGDDYFTMFRNDGTGTATIDPASSELIDGMGSMQVQPGESLMLICTGTQWYSVGYGRSTLYQFTQLTKDVSAGGTITLSTTEAANKLITFIGNPSAAVEVVVPAVVAVYYTQSAVSTAQTVTLKTSAGSGVGISQGARVIALCDGTNVVSAQSAVANTSVSLTDGSALVPSLFFATQTNTGLFKSGTQDVGVTVNGSTVGVFGSTGLQTATIGPNSTQRHTLPAISSDTVTLNTATQTLTNKTLSVDNNTISGIAASSFVLSNASGNIDGSAAQKVIPTGVVVGTTDTQTLTNKTLSSPIISSPTGITKTDVGLGNVDNTSDANKPISTAQQSALDLKLNTSGGTITANSTDPALKITQTGSGNALVVEDSTSTDSTPFVIDGGGNVIIGRSTALSVPQYNNAGDTVPALQLHGVGLSTTAISSSFWANSQGSCPELIFNKSRGAAVGTHAVVSNGDVIGAIHANASNGTAFQTIASARFDVDGAPDPGSMPGRLVFSTTPPGSNTPLARMYIGSNGGVGIGTPAIAGSGVQVGKATGAASSTGFYSGVTVLADVTEWRAFTSLAQVGGGTALTTLAHFRAQQGTISAEGSIATQYGFIAESGLVGATNNYGFLGNIPTGTGRWNFYAAGTADNAFAGKTAIGSVTPPTVTLEVNATDAVKLPVGTAAQRPTGVAGYLRFNTTSGQFEGYNGTAWGTVGGGATGGAGNAAFYENDTTITANYTITTGKNAMTAGPVTINNGVTVTVPSGSVWTIV